MRSVLVRGIDSQLPSRHVLAVHTVRYSPYGGRTPYGVQSGSAKGFGEANFGADQVSLGMPVITLSFGADVLMVPYRTEYRTTHTVPYSYTPYTHPHIQTGHSYTDRLLRQCHFCTES